MQTRAECICIGVVAQDAKHFGRGMFEECAPHVRISPRHLTQAPELSIRFERLVFEPAQKTEGCKRVVEWKHLAIQIFEQAEHHVLWSYNAKVQIEQASMPLYCFINVRAQSIERCTSQVERRPIVDMFLHLRQQLVLPDVADASENSAKLCVGPLGLSLHLGDWTWSRNDR